MTDMPAMEALVDAYGLAVDLQLDRRARRAALLAAIAECARQRDVLIKVCETLTRITDMTDAELAQLKGNCQAAMTEGR